MIPLRTTPATAAAQLRDTAARTTQVSIGGRPAEQIRNDYLNWADQAELLLGNHFTASFVEDVIRTRDYWLFRTKASSEPRLVGEICTELRRQERRLMDLALQLDELERRWSGDHPTEVLAVPDTNMFLRTVPFWDLPLDQYLGTEAVRIVLPIVVIHELDGRKRQKNTEKAARTALRWLYGVLPKDPSQRAALRANVTIEVWADDGPLVPDPDALIIEMAGQLAALSSSPVRLVTHDLAMRIRAQGRGVEAVYLPEDATIPAPSGPVP